MALDIGARGECSPAHFQQLQAARNRLVALDSERRRLVEHSLLASGSTPPKEAHVEQSLIHASTSSTSPKPEWLLADGRLLTACLEGENRALRRAVQQAKLEIDELVQRRCSADERATSLAAENRAAAEALRKCGPLTAKGLPALETLDKAATPGDKPPLPSDSAAAASLRLLLLSDAHRYGNASSALGHAEKAAEGPFEAALARLPAPAPEALAPKAPTAPKAQQVPAEAEATTAARERLLETSQDIGRRMDEILARRGKLQVVLDAETDVGSSALSGESTEGSSASRHSPGGGTVRRPW